MKQVVMKQAMDAWFANHGVPVEVQRQREEIERRTF